MNTCNVNAEQPVALPRAPCARACACDRLATPVNGDCVFDIDVAYTQQFIVQRISSGGDADADADADAGNGGTTCSSQLTPVHTAEKPTVSAPSTRLLPWSGRKLTTESHTDDGVYCWVCCVFLSRAPTAPGVPTRTVIKDAHKTWKNALRDYGAHQLTDQHRRAEACHAVVSRLPPSRTPRDLAIRHQAGPRVLLSPIAIDFSPLLARCTSKPCSAVIVASPWPGVVCLRPRRVGCTGEVCQ